HEEVYICSDTEINVNIYNNHSIAAPAMMPTLPYLFLRHPTARVINGKVIVRFPSESDILYWSFDPSGEEKLDADSLEQLDLPDVICETMDSGSSWTSSHYRGMREVHRAKGFDPDGPDLAIAWGYPLMAFEDSRLEGECDLSLPAS
ncbi:hypothetical protein C8R47DRAFT_967659, partial [Mycena vitilis]